ncbi:glycosyltransferase family 4 protein [Elizabethkingia anophelis]|uniref:glycosyltransferase family 4 protein n=2 Tax=Elizabethkingia anophelis TaxID=1117645 RepID=UPI000442B788|nr:glycosyltransferase family 4 protein [Elizabethkingia anophelis]AVF48058.1 glycosyltransferase family 1 protein [Elizabethkingia anophelis]AVF52052.1 glycosyltransferase family 1 protein [Elizabethkingia anophelis]MBG0505668.1 glycosyltransferase family 4 protein [Elizabethkingia anophelis]MCT3816421.1 glycosyltransferase family 4 protein [Elizabethkingia anophelis]MCT3873659.1 glycosyltransferase family 4 protein [Elizabethkingia anophelis]
MKLIIDNSNLFAGGGLQVAVSFLRDLKKINLSDEFHIIQSLNAIKVIENEQFPDNFTFYNLGKSEEKSKSKRIRSVKKIESIVNPDCIFTLFGPSYHKSKYPKLVGFAIPYIIYQNSPFFKKISVKENIYYKLLSILKVYSFKKYSDALIFETENARKTFVEKTHYNKDTYTVGNTLNKIFFEPNEWKDYDKLPTSSFKILFLTANYPHKNMDVIPEVIKILKHKYKFNDFKFLITLHSEELNFPEYCEEYIEYLGKVDLKKIPSLYNQSQIVFIPTLLEVFSATYLEAMLMKKPIIASDLEFSRDICGESAYFCEPVNAESYAEAIFRLANDENLRNRLVNKGTENLKRFGSSMERTVSYLNIIKTLIKKNAHSK